MKWKNACMVLVRHHAGKKIERVQNEILGIWLEKHPFEKLVDGEELTRRGESFLLDVYLPWKREVKYLGLKKFTDRIELLKKKDEKWTQKKAVYLRPFYPKSTEGRQPHERIARAENILDELTNSFLDVVFGVLAIEPTNLGQAFV